MNNKKLLVITDGFPEISTNSYHCQFVYEQTKLVENFFSNVTVVSPQPYLPEFLQKFPRLSGFSKLSGFHDYQIGKISVQYPTYFTLPLGYFRERNNIRVAKSIILDEKFDIVHVHFLYPTGEAASTKIPASIPKILSLHGGDVYKWAANPVHIERARHTWRLYDRLHLPSEYLKNILLKLDPAINPGKIFVIPPSFDETIFYPKPKTSKTVNILMVANLVESKGHLDALQAFKTLLPLVPKARLQIVGTGPFYIPIVDKIAELSLGDSVDLIGPVKHVDLAEYYHEATMLLFPSYRESFGIVQIEAMACGTPIVAYSNEGSKEIFEKYPKRLVKVGDINGLAERIIKVIREEIDSDELRELVKPYTRKVIAKRFRELYRF